MLDQPSPDTPPIHRHPQLIKDRTPEWLLQAKPVTHAAVRKAADNPPSWLTQARSTQPALVSELQKAYARHRDNERQIRPLLERLVPIETFAQPLLTAALKSRFGMDLDVMNTHLFHASRAVVDQSFMAASKDPLVQANMALKAATRPLLTAALQNFEEWETKTDAMDKDAGTKARIFSSCQITGPYITGTELDIAPGDFADLCRKLDLGGQYQALLRSILQPPDRPHVPVQDNPKAFMRVETSSIELQLRIAYLKGLIGKPAYDAMLELLAGNRQVMIDDVPVSCTVLKLWDVELTGIFTMGKNRDTASQVEKVVVYIPDDPIAPLKEYESAAAFQNSLRDRMFVSGYQQFFKRFIPARHRNRVMSKLFERLNPTVKKGGVFERQWLEQEEDRNARLDLHESPMTGRLAQTVLERKQAALLDDALFHGVPTASLDQKTAADRLKYFEEKTLEVLNIAAFVVPGLGEIMLAVTAAQLIHEVYEGVESWAHDDRQQAIAYLFDVVENVALLAALGAASTSGPGIAAVQVPEFVNALEPIGLSDGTTRLWKPDLSPFAHDIVLPKNLKPDALGLYHYQGKQWLALEGRTYSVLRGPADNGYVMEHPARPDSYQPQLRHNGAGAWLHELDRPLQMEGLTLFRKLGYTRDVYADLAAERIVRTSGTTESVMRRALANAQRPPALLEDTARRFRLDQEIDGFIERMHANDPDADPSMQLELLSQDPGWPADRTLQLLNADDTVANAFPALTPADAVTSVRVRMDQPDVLQQVLEQLSAAEIRTLMNEEFGAGQISLSSRLKTLRARLAGRGRVIRNRWFDARYQSLKNRLEGSAAQGAQAVGQAFPNLPSPVTDELIRHASPAELSQMSESGRVPLRIAEEARVYQRQIRLARAYEGLYLKSVASADSDCLILHSIEALPGWSPQVGIEVHDGFFGGPLVDRIGNEDAPIRKILVKEGNRYEARDSDDGHLHGLDDLYTALLHALPDAQRAELGFPRTDQGQELAAIVGQRPLPRKTLAPLLNMQPLKPGSKSPMRLADGRLGYPLSGRGNTDWHMTDDSLLDKLRLLEFDDAFPEDILGQLRAIGWDNRIIDHRLNALLDEQQTLRASLDAWSDEVVSLPPMNQAHIDSRVRIHEAILDHWRLNSLPEIGRTRLPLRLQSVSLMDFPARLPDFVYSRVHALRLENISVEPRMPTSIGPVMNLPRQAANSIELGSFLRRFPRTRSLILSSDPAPGAASMWSEFFDLPRQVASALPQLAELGLINQGVLLDQLQLGALRDLTELRVLDLSGNQTSVIPPMNLSWLRLDRLVLERLGLHRWPAWLTELIPDNVRELSVAHNDLTDIPDQILENPRNPTHQTLIDLRGNSLSRYVAIRARINETAPYRSFRFNLDIPPALQAALNMQIQQGADLMEALDQWTQASGSQTRPSDQTVEARRSIGNVIIDHWRTFSLGQIHTPLRLSDIALADIPPQLPDFFRRQVRYLHLSRVTGTAQELDQLLQRFTELKVLEMRGHVTPLAELPQALLNLRSLSALNLSDQGLIIDQQHIEFFSRLPKLERLELDHNRIGTIDSLTSLNNTALHWLSLNSVGLNAWPRWIDEMIPAPLTTLLLEGNQITEIPDNILANPNSRNAHTEISLLDNPLSDDSMRRARQSERYGRSFTFDMDLTPELRELDEMEGHDSDSPYDSDSSGEDSSPSSPTPSRVDTWLVEDDPQSAERRKVWQQVEETGQARNLLDLIGSLRHTADYRNTVTRPQLRQRVWQVLSAAGDDPQLLMTLNGIAEEPLRLFRGNDTCPDGVILEFNQMEVLAFTRQSLQDVVPEQRGATLYRLTTRLYRLSELDAAAREQAGGRDEAEVRLAYRTHWANALELPVPPAGMLFEAHAAIRPGEFDMALNRVQTGEQGEPLLKFAAQQEYWVAYLREAYADRFQALERTYRSNMTKLTDEFEVRDISLDHPEYEGRMREFESQSKDDEQRLIKELTNLESLQQA